MMGNQHKYELYPTELYYKGFKSKKDKNFHLLAMALFVSLADSETGEFSISIRELAKRIGCANKRAKQIIDNFLEWEFVQRISIARNRYGKSVYKLSATRKELERDKWDALLF